MDFTSSDRFMKAVNGYEKYECMGEFKWFDEQSRALADEVFDETRSLIEEIARDNGVLYNDVLGEVRKVSRY